MSQSKMHLDSRCSCCRYNCHTVHTMTTHINKMFGRVAREHLPSAGPIEAHVGKMYGPYNYTGEKVHIHLSDWTRSSTSSGWRLVAQDSSKTSVITMRSLAWTMSKLANCLDMSSISPEGASEALAGPHAGACADGSADLTRR